MLAIGKYDFETVHTLIDQCPLLHVAFNGGGHFLETEQCLDYPVILPMLGCTGIFPSPRVCEDDGTRYIYLHGYVSSRFFRKAAGPQDQGEDVDESDANTSVPVCISATHLDGIVMALTPNHHSCNYRSVVAYGRAHLVQEEAERLYAMELITDNLIPGRWQNTRYPSSAELKATGIIRVEVDSASAKVRTGTTGESRADLQDEVMKKNVWAGVVPVHTVLGQPIAAPTNTCPKVPAYIDEWRSDFTYKSQKYAYDSGHT